MLRRLLLLFVILLAPSINASSDIPIETITRCKHATGYVFIGDDSSATAFHIGGGLFVTNAHVVVDAGNQKIQIVVNPGESTQRVLPATVLRKDDKLDLAVLTTVDNLQLDRLIVGSAEGLIETAQVTAFGYPFGNDLALGKSDYPGITVSVGRITALRKSDGILDRVQLDASLNPGNSGGPVIDATGTVVAVVEAGILGTGVNFAIPANRLRQFLFGSSVTLTGPALDKATEHAPGMFAIVYSGDQPTSGDLSAILTLTTGANDRREYKATQTQRGSYTVSAPLIPDLNSGLYEATVNENGSTFTVILKDQTLKLAGKPLAISKIKAIKLGAAAHITMMTGDAVDGPLKGLEELEVIRNGATAIMDVSDAVSISMAPSKIIPDKVRYKVEIRHGEEVVSKQEGEISAGGILPNILAENVAPLGTIAAGTELSYLDVVMTDHPVAYYRLDERSGDRAHDHSGNHTDLTISGSVAPLRRGALVSDSNGAMLFGGDGSLHVEGPEAKTLALTSSFTAEAWFIQTEFKSTQTIFCKGIDHTAGSFRFFYNGGHQRYQFSMTLEGTMELPILDDVIDEKLVPPMEWHYVVVQFDEPAHELRCYIDNRLLGTLGAGGKKFKLNTEGFQIGSMIDNNNGGAREFFVGAIDEVAIYNGLLSPERMTKHYRFGSGKLK